MQQPKSRSKSPGRPVPETDHGRESIVSSGPKKAPSAARRRAKPAKRAVRKSDLSPARRKLVERMQKLGFGKIKHLVVTDGEPVMNPPPKVFRHQRLTGASGAGANKRRGDFILKRPLVEMFEAFDRLGNGIVDTIKVHDGLPCGFDIEEPGLL